MPCTPRCHFTATLDHATGRRLMVGQGGKYGQGEVHAMCDSCLKEIMEEGERAIAKAEAALDPCGDAKFNSFREWLADAKKK